MSLGHGGPGGLSLQFLPQAAPGSHFKARRMDDDWLTISSILGAIAGFALATYLAAGLLGMVN